MADNQNISTTGNPFHTLFTQDKFEDDVNVEEENYLLLEEKNDLAERIFLLTTELEEHYGPRTKCLPAAAVYVPTEGDITLSLGIKSYVANRLNYDNPQDYVVDRNGEIQSSLKDKNVAAEKNCMKYLFMSFQRLQIEKTLCSSHLKATLVEWQKIISEAMSEKIISSNYNKAKFNELLETEACSFNVSSDFTVMFQQVIDFISAFQRSNQLIYSLFEPTLVSAAKTINQASLDDPSLLKFLKMLSFFALHPLTAEMIINFKLTTNISQLHINVSPLMAEMLKKTALVTNPRTEEFVFFERISTASRNNEEEVALQSVQGEYHESLTEIYKNMCKNKESREKLMAWIGEFLETNSYLSKMWVHHQVNPTVQVLETDAIFFNLSSVLLRLCQPFCSCQECPRNSKFLKINPYYCAVTGLDNKEDRLLLGVHTGKLEKETCFMPAQEEFNIADIDESINFITEVFFFTHRSLYLSCHGLIENFYRSSRLLNRLERIYSGDRSSDIVSAFERGMTVYLSTKASLTDPIFVQLSSNFFATTAQYLCHISGHGKNDDFITCKYLSYTPEFLIENLVDFVVFLQRFAKPSLSKLMYAKNDFMCMISIFMGSKTKMSNPHLRCTLIDALNALFYFEDETDMSDCSPKTWLEKYTEVEYLVMAVLQICVDMEIARDEQLSYQKFGFRSTLYKLLKIMWSTDNCKQVIINSANYACKNIEDPRHPLFLNFIDLILNDITYLLDEAMSHLIAIKDAERAKANGEWDGLPENERNEKEEKLDQDINVARYYNTLSNLTLETLVYLSADIEIKNLLCHPILVERVALMVNDFLVKLVGPRMGALRVQDFSQSNFDPKRLVTDICTLYTNMMDQEIFCQSVVKDGRSYNDQLLSRAVRVLMKINNVEIMKKFTDFANICRTMGVQESLEEEIFKDAPEDFYDQLTFTIMSDPVILPVSRNIVDRSTISRHLLGDTTDPFNRQPLTMDQVLPHTELKSRIQKWKNDWKEKNSK